MEFLPVRIYEHEQPTGYRVLVDRLWPRGVSKEKAALDLWAKEIAPSTDLRKWFNHDEQKFAEFSSRYKKELDENSAVNDLIKQLQDADATRVLLLFGAKETKVNDATVLADYLKERADKK